MRILVSLCAAISYFFVDLGLGQLKDECAAYRGRQFASSTRQTRLVQLHNYDNFCRLFGLSKSSSSGHVCLYVTFLARTMCFSSIRQYLSALNNYFLDNGYRGINYDSRVLIACLAGIRRSIGDASSQAYPLLPMHFNRMFVTMDWTVSNVAVWAAMLLCFRTLLHQSHVTEGCKVLRRGRLYIF